MCSTGSHNQWTKDNVSAYSNGQVRKIRINFHFKWILLETFNKVKIHINHGQTCFPALCNQIRSLKLGVLVTMTSQTSSTITGLHALREGVPKSTYRLLTLHAQWFCSASVRWIAHVQALLCKRVLRHQQPSPTTGCHSLKGWGNGSESACIPLFTPPHAYRQN